MNHFTEIQLKAAQQWLHEQIEISSHLKWQRIGFWHFYRTTGTLIWNQFNGPTQDPNYVTS